MVAYAPVETLPVAYVNAPPGPAPVNAIPIVTIASPGVAGAPPLNTAVMTQQLIIYAPGTYPLAPVQPLPVYVYTHGVTPERANQPLAAIVVGTG